MNKGTDFYASAVLKKPVINASGQILGKLWDLVMEPGENLPIVTGLLVKSGKALHYVPWGKVAMINPMVISVASNEPITSFSTYSSNKNDILIGDDILDKQIVDVNGAKVVRVNDLKLVLYMDKLCIYSVDAGFGGLIRRLGYERLWKWFRKELPKKEIGWQFVSTLEPNTVGLTLALAHDQMSEMHPADIADIITQIPINQIQAVLDNLDIETVGDTIYELDAELRSQIITELNSEKASDILEEMDPDEAADVLGDLSEEKAEELLGLIEDKEDAEEIQELMIHKEDTAGGLMNSDFITVSPVMTVEKALAETRRLAEDIGTIYYAYVLDKDERLKGIVSLRDILISDPAVCIYEIMTEKIKSVDIDAEPEEILMVLAKYNLIAVPVIAPNKKMVGIVTIDDIVEIFLPHAVKRQRHSV